MIIPVSHPGYLDSANLGTLVMRLDRPVTIERFVPMVAVAPSGGAATFRLTGEDGNFIDASIADGEFTGEGAGSTTGTAFTLTTIADNGARWMRGYAQTTLRTGARYFAPLIYPGTIAQGDRYSFSVAPYDVKVARLLPAVATAPSLAPLTLRLQSVEGSTDDDDYVQARLPLSELAAPGSLGDTRVSAGALMWLEAVDSDGTAAYSRHLAELLLHTPFVGSLFVVPIYHPGIIADGESILIRSPGVNTTLTHFFGNFGVPNPGTPVLSAEVEGSPGEIVALGLSDWETHSSEAGSLSVLAGEEIRVRFVALGGRQDYFRGILVFEALGETPGTDIGLKAKIRLRGLLEGVIEARALLEGKLRARAVLEGAIWLNGERRMDRIYVANDNLVELRGLITQDDEISITGATVTARLLNTDGTEVTGQTWPESMTADGSGNYEGLIRDTAVLAHGQEYRLEIIADDGTDKRAKWLQPVRAENRED